MLNRHKKARFIGLVLRSIIAVLTLYALEGNFRFVHYKSDLKSASDKKFVRKATVAMENKICEQNTTPCCERLALSCFR